MAVTTKEDILRAIVKPAIMEKLVDVEEDAITPEASIADDLNADSLDIVEIGMAVEELAESKAGVKLEIGDKDMEGIKTVGDMVSALADKLGIAA